MTEDPKDDDSADQAEFQRVLENLVNTPPKPHVKERDTDAPPKSGGGQDG